MRYRTNKRTGDRISEIGIGSSYMYEAGAKEAVGALRRAAEGGVNYFDLAAGDGATFAMYGEALCDLREGVYLQIHLLVSTSDTREAWMLRVAFTSRAAGTKEVRNLEAVDTRAVVGWYA